MYVTYCIGNCINNLVKGFRKLPNQEVAKRKTDRQRKKSQYYPFPLQLASYIAQGSLQTLFGKIPYSKFQKHIL